MIRYKTPQELLESRFVALQTGDYSKVYASYHPEAPFRHQFSGEADYLVFARQQLTQIELHDWRVLGERHCGEGQLEVILCMEIHIAGGSQYFYEMALLITTDRGWRYHSAQKLGAEDFFGSPQQLDFLHFDQVVEKIRL